VTRKETVMATTGDGAILVFGSAAQAHQFAVAVHAATAEHNRNLTQPLAKRVFRSGAATGEIVMEPKPGGGYEIAGTTIARAVRLEAKAQPGGFQVDEATYQALAEDQRGRYGGKVQVAGKRDELFVAFACLLNADGPQDAYFFVGGGGGKPPVKPPVVATGGFGPANRRQVLALFKKLKSHQYDELIFLLEMPISQRPPGTQTLDEKKGRILIWAEENYQLGMLLDVLRELTETEGNTPPP